MEVKEEKKKIVYEYSCGDEEILSVSIIIYFIKYESQQRFYHIRLEQTSSTERFYDLDIGDGCKKIHQTTETHDDEIGLSTLVIDLDLSDNSNKRPEQLFKTNAW